MNTMTRAHQIKKEAAKKWNCQESEIVFGICLKMAHEEKKMQTGTNLAEIARKCIGILENKKNPTKHLSEVVEYIKNNLNDDLVENGVDVIENDYSEPEFMEDLVNRTMTVVEYSDYIGKMSADEFSNEMRYCRNNL